MRSRAVIFDLDGTLLDSVRDIASSYNRVLAARGFPTHSVETFRSFIGDGASECARRALPTNARTEATIRDCVEDYRTDYAENWKTTTRPYKGIPELLNVLGERGVPLAVFSNKPQADTSRCVEAFFGSERFALVLGQSDELERKPHPSGALRIASRFGVPPEECALVGDTEVDMQTAVAAGMVAAGVLWGFRDREVLVRSGADFVLDTPEGLISIVS